MRLEELIVAGNGFVVRSEALARVPRAQIDAAVRRNRLTVHLLGVLVDPYLLDDPAVRQRAALRYASQGGRHPVALSHTSALVHLGLLEPTEPAVTHVTVPEGVRLAGGEGIDIHTAKHWDALGCRLRGGLPTVGVEWACVTGWSLVPIDTRRSPLICAVRERRTTVARISAILEALPHVTGRAEMTELCSMLAAGAHSEFEVWGLQTFYPASLLARSHGQLPIRVGRRTYYADRGFLEEMVAHELDGTRYHDTPEQRRRDARRDAALARIGWLTLRVDYRRAHDETADALAELEDTLAMRRRQFGLPCRRLRDQQSGCIPLYGVSRCRRSVDQPLRGGSGVARRRRSVSRDG